MNISSGSSLSSLAITAAAAATVAAISYVTFSRLFFQNKKKNHSAFDDHEGKIHYPPLPEDVKRLLEQSSLCFLATTDDDEPHLSLMNFTYYDEEDILVFCTRRNTKKFSQLMKSPRVAVLIHDFPNISKCDDGLDSKFAQTCSITLSGSAKCLLDSAPSSQRYRGIHLHQNPKYAQFIEGDGIAVVIVKIESARICDIRDRVRVWNVKDGMVK